LALRSTQSLIERSASGAYG